MPNVAAVQSGDPAYLKAAFSKLGLSEIAGPKHEKQVLAMYVASGHPEIIDDETPWCAAFVGWALVKGNLPNTGSLLAISYAKYGTALDKKKPIPRGAIAVWKRTGGNHVNFIIADDGKTVTCIGGNQENGKGGGVTISYRPKAQALAYRMPIAVEAADPVAPAATTGTKVARVVGLTTAAGAAVSQTASVITGPVAENVQQIKEVIDTGGQVVDVSKQVVQVAPSGFWAHALSAAQSPKFLLAVLVVIIVAWGLTYYLRTHKEA